MKSSSIMKALVILGAVAVIVLVPLTIVGHDYYIYHEAKSISLVLAESKIAGWYFAEVGGYAPDGEVHYSTILLASNPNVVENGIEIYKEKFKGSGKCTGKCASFKAGDIKFIRYLVCDQNVKCVVDLKGDFLTKQQDRIFVFRQGRPSSVSLIASTNPIKIASTSKFMADYFEIGRNTFWMLSGTHLYIGRNLKNRVSLDGGKSFRIELPEGLYASEFHIQNKAEFSHRQITDNSRQVQSNTIQAGRWTGLFHF